MPSCPSARADGTAAVAMPKRVRSMTLGIRMLACAALASLAAAAHAGPVVGTDRGAVEGVDQGVTEAFLGVPYAAPPVGPMRWREPGPVVAWEGVRAAHHHAPACQQGLAQPWGPYTAEFVAGAPVSEDCLYLNVWRPEHGARRLPVLMFIHGGAYQGGSGSLPIYDGARLAARGAVVVTINYRVGVLGFLAHPALTAESPLHSSGNYGLLDQIAALRWVQSNIARFGGDPANVTIAGESAGAASVNNLIMMPLAQGLFRQAIAFSGASMAIETPELVEGERRGEALARQLGAASIDALRAVPAETLIDASRVVPVEGGGPPSLRFVPHHDAAVLPLDPADPTQPVASPVPYMTGFNSAEMIDQSVATPDQFTAAVRRRYGQFADRLLALYPHATNDEARQSNELLARDRYMTGLLLWSAARSRASGQRVYAYLYHHPYPVVRGGISWGTFHSSGLPYVFGTIGLGDRAWSPADGAVVRRWQDRVLAFMRRGDPSLPNRRWRPAGDGMTQVMGIGDVDGMHDGVSSAARLEALRAYAASGGSLGLM